MVKDWLARHPFAVHMVLLMISVLLTIFGVWGGFLATTVTGSFVSGMNIMQLLHLAWDANDR